MKQIYTLLLIVLIASFNSVDINAQELVELVSSSMQELEGNTTARVNMPRDNAGEPLKDINGNNLALLIIKHNFKNFIIETAITNEGIIRKPGETWVWLSPEEYEVVITKEGYIPFTCPMCKLEALKTYEISVSDGYASLEVVAPNAKIWLNERFVSDSKYIFRLKEGQYTVKATRDKYHTKEEFVSLKASESRVLSINMKPKLGSLKLDLKQLNVDVYIDNKRQNNLVNKSLPLIIGDHHLKLKKEDYLPYSKDFSVNESQLTTLNIDLVKDPTILMKKYKKKRNFWLISTLVTAGVGLYAHTKGNSLYDDYDNATTDAADIRSQIDTYDTLKPIAFGAAGVCFLAYIINGSKYKKAKRKLKLNPLYTHNGGGMSLCYTF
ncbi:hypothetical protein L3073_09450 [Ancylomarina sp. DW003]|nr:hypothetical protein [Ancylomarina sp. DW003]MDE5422430.1 hypothetical protein [Ancylomarina sp. DW003]